MKKIFTLLTIITLSVVALKVNAQSGFSDLIKSSPADATKLVDAYGSSLFKGFGVGNNSGWTNTAKTRKLLGFDLRITASGAFVPSSDKTFDVTKIGLSDHVGVKAGYPNNTATFGGKDAGVTTIETFDDNHNKVGEFQMPKGVTSVIPAPQLQLTVGIIKNTDVTLRAIPKIKMGDDVGSVSQIGFGVKHNIIQDFAGPAGKLIPFDLAVAIGYSRLNLDIPLEVNPESGSVAAPGNNNNDFKNQHIDGHFNNLVFQAILSKKLTVFTPFVALGYNHTKTSVAALGNYPVTTSTGFYETFTNPISINKTSVSGMRADLGFQLELGVFRFYASGTLATYSSVNAGIGFGI